jgi:hypothetical protein
MVQKPFFGKRDRSLEVGKKADIVLMNMNRPEWQPCYLGYEVTNLVYSASGDSVDTVIIDGNIAAARNDAISDALLKGLEEYLTRYLGSQIMINNFPRLINNVIPDAKDEIENFIPAKKETAATHDILTLLKQGRQPGISLVLITQRPNKIHEDAKIIWGAQITKELGDIVRALLIVTGVKAPLVYSGEFFYKGKTERELKVICRLFFAPTALKPINFLL